MAYLRRMFHVPASESSIGVLLTLCVVALGLMSIALLWQAQIIANQRDVIRWLEVVKLGA
jgi:cyanate permease